MGGALARRLLREHKLTVSICHRNVGPNSLRWARRWWIRRRRWARRRTSC